MVICAESKRLREWRTLNVVIKGDLMAVHKLLLGGTWGHWARPQPEAKKALAIEGRAPLGTTDAIATSAVEGINIKGEEQRKSSRAKRE